MKLKRVSITNFKGIRGTTIINLSQFNSIVGQNDAGKSTILKAIDAVLNNTTLLDTDFNLNATSDELIIELYFDCQNHQYTLGEEIPTSMEAEEITNDENLLVYRKVWKVSNKNISKPKTSLVYKKYEDNQDFLFKTEPQLISLCNANGIETSKGNGDEYNNVEKRQKLRAFNAQNQTNFEYAIIEIPSSGTSKAKAIGDSIKSYLPSFQYFKADTSLSDTDTTIQKYFRHGVQTYSRGS